MDWLTDPDVYIGFITLLALEVVLGIDNIVFLSILTGTLPEDQRPKARKIGLGLALIMRILLLLTLSAILALTHPLFSVFDHGFSGQDLILLVGGLFLIAKSTYEIHDKLEGTEGHSTPKKGGSFKSVVVQIVVIDLVFSLDSVITAVGMVDRIAVMIAAVTVAVGIMLVAAKPVGDFVDRHPTIKMLALAFLLMIGFSLLLEGLGNHIPKGFIYVAMGFSLFVEALNLRAKKVAKEKDTVKLHSRYSDEADPEQAEADGPHSNQ